MKCPLSLALSPSEGERGLPFARGRSFMEKHACGHEAGLRRAGVGQGFGEEEASATQAGTRALN